MNSPLLPRTYKNLNILILALFLILLAGAVVYVQERMLFCDASYISFYVLNLDTFYISENRYGSFITQMFPLIAGKLQLPLYWAILLYSISFNLFYLTVAALVMFRFKNTLLALLMSFYYILFVTDTYFWTNNEIHQAIAWMFLFFAFVLHFKKQPYHWLLHALIFVVLAVLAIYTHPLILLVLPLLWIFFMSDKGNRPYTLPQLAGFSLLIMAIFAIKFLTMKEGSYDKGKIPGISLQGILGAFTSPMAGIFVKKLVTHYYFVPVLFIWGMYSAFQKKKFLQIILVSGCMLGYFIAVCMAFNSFIPFYHESEWMPFSIIAAVPFVYYTMPQLKPGVATIVIAVIFIVRLISIGGAAEKFTERKNWLYATLGQMKEQGITKGYIHTGDTATDNLLQMSWALPAESLMASALQGDRPCLTFFADTPEKAAERAAEAGWGMVASFATHDVHFFNTTYFSIDGSGPYQPIDTGREKTNH